MNGLSCSSRCYILVALIGVALAGFVSPANLVAAQQTGLKDMTYVSPIWGYTIRWYSSEWTVGSETSEGETDTLVLHDSLGNSVTFSGTPQAEGDATTCLDGMIEEALAVPGAVDAEPVEDNFGEPYEWRESNQAYTLFQVRIPVGDVLQDHAVYLECQTLVPDEAVFQRIYSGPVTVFDQWYDDIVETLEGVNLPASAWWPMPDASGVWAGSAPLLGSWRANGALVPSADDPQLFIGEVDATGDTRVVTFENVGSAPASVEPANLMLTVSSMMSEDEGGPPQQPNATTWVDGENANADGSRELAPGEQATVQVSFAPVDGSAFGCDGLPSLDLEYLQPNAGPVLLASQPFEACLDDSIDASASAGRPLLRLSR